MTPAARASDRVRFGASVLRIGSLLGGACAIFNWSGEGYGAMFWLWVVSLLGYVVSFPPARTRGADVRRPVRIAFLLLLVGAGALRLPQLEAVPGNISVDEVLPGLEARAIATGERENVFSDLGWFHLPSLTFAFPAAVMLAIPGDPLFTLRLSSLITGLLGIAVTFLLGRRLFDDRAALLASFFMAASFWHVHNSRTGFPFVQSSFAVPLVLYLLVRARQDASSMAMALAGVAAGFSLQLYFPVRVLLVLVPLFLVADWWQSRERPLRMLQEAATLAVGTLLVLLPLLTSETWQNLTGRSRGVYVTNPAKVEELGRVYGVDGLAAVVLRNVREAAGMFVDWADVCILNRSPDGLLDDLSLIAVAIGALAALMRGHGWHLVVLLWATFVFLFGAALTDAPRASYRLAPAMPALFFLAATGVLRILPRDSGTPGWYRRMVWPLVFLAGGSFVVQENYRRFFVDYARHGHGQDVSASTAMRLTGADCDGRMFYVLARPEPLGGEQTFDFFCPQHRPLRRSQIPGAVDRSRAATFLVMPWRKGDLKRIEECYPQGRVAEYRRSDGVALLTRVDVDRDDVSRGRERCPRQRLRPRGTGPMDLTAERHGGGRTPAGGERPESRVVRGP